MVRTSGHPSILAAWLYPPGSRREDSSLRENWPRCKGLQPPTTVSLYPSHCLHYCCHGYCLKTTTVILLPHTVSGGQGLGRAQVGRFGLYFSSGCGHIVAAHRSAEPLKQRGLAQQLLPGSQHGHVPGEPRESRIALCPASGVPQASVLPSSPVGPASEGGSVESTS